MSSKKKSKGYVKIHRSIFDENRLKPHAALLFIYLIAVANNKPAYYHGIMIDVGETVRSLNQISIKTNMTWRSVQKNLKILEDDSKITCTPVKIKGNDAMLIRIINYRKYQGHAPDDEDEYGYYGDPDEGESSEDEFSDEVKDFELWK